METESWPQGDKSHIRQLVLWCDELAELQALQRFLATALADTDSTHSQDASLLAGQLQRRLQQLREQVYTVLCSFRA